ncbi:MAG TPA: hypothetical protein VGZ93_09530 [Candidatus Methylacidiphilales bacterium]|nr:hypothetical protein [Candidatus Methylacidiphilales bacterium]
MNRDGELEALFALARKRRPDMSAAEFAFETRLMARLRAREETGSIWAMVSWRLVPFFAVCVAGLALWQAETASDTTDAANIAGLNNPVAADLWSN